MSPSSSAFGTNAATLSSTTTSSAVERTMYSTISRACSAESGWEINNDGISTPMALAYAGSTACSTST